MLCVVGNTISESCFDFSKNGKPQKRGKMNLVGRLQLSTERSKEEDNESIVQLRILRVQVRFSNLTVNVMRKKVCHLMFHHLPHLKAERSGPLYHVSCEPLGFSEMTIQPARLECHACCPLHAEKPGIQPVVGNTHGTHVEQVVSSFQKILRSSQLTWYT